MPVLQGNMTQVSVRNETTWQTTAAGDRVLPGMGVTSFNAEVDEGITADRYAGAGSGRNISRFQRGNIAIRATLEGELQNTIMAPYFFGKNTDTGSPTYNHAVIESGAVPFFSLEDAKSGTTSFTETFAGGMVDEWTLAGAQGEKIKSTHNLIFATGSPATAAGTALTYRSGAQLDPYHFNMTAFEISGGGFNGQLLEVIGFSWTGRQGLILPYYGVGSRAISKPIPDSRSYEYTINMYNPVASGGTIYTNLFRGGSECNLDLYFLRSSGGTTAATDKVQLWMSGCKTLKADHPTVPEGALSFDVTFQPSSCGMTTKDASGDYFAYLV